MKKLMCAFAALVAGLAVADITSSNIVGYQTKTTVAGMNFVTPTFKNVSGTTISVQDIKLSGENVTEYVDLLAVLDEFGNAKSDANFLWTESDGWVTDAFEPATLTLKPGEGVVISTLNSGVSVTFAGEVLRDDIKMYSVAGMNFIGNAAPATTDVQGITLSGDNVTEYVDLLAVLDEYGNAKTDANFLWTESDGWVNDSFEQASLTLQPGEGVVISTLNSDVEINIPAAEL